jgi:predicted transcriptional regulator
MGCEGMNKALLLSVKAEYAQMIFDGKKTIELRRRRPGLKQGDYLIIYVPRPCKCIVGVASVEQVISARPQTLWRKVRQGCALAYPEFRSYFSEALVGHGIFLSRPARLTSSLGLDAIREVQPSFTPQGYKYLSRADIAEALECLRWQRSAG